MDTKAAAFLRQHIELVMAAVDHNGLTFEYTVRKEMTNPFISQAG